MNNLFIIFNIILFSFLTYAESTFASQYVLVNFDESMGYENEMQYNLMLRSSTSQEILQFYRDLYNKNNFNTVQFSEVPKIPKIIHHIWVGPKPIPEKYLKYAEECRSIHPTWEYKLWREKDIEQENFDRSYMKLFENFGTRYNGKKDVVEYLILYKYGGVVMDMDFKCIKPLDELHHKYDLYAGLEPPVRWSKIPVFTNAIIGSKPGNQIFLQTLNEGVKQFDEEYHNMNSGLKYFVRKIKSYFVKREMIRIPDGRQILMQPLGSNIRKNINDLGVPIILPATYFNPIFPNQFPYNSLIDKLKIYFGFGSRKNFFDKQRIETIAIQDFKH